jgi:hypothetical protein
MTATDRVGPWLGHICAGRPWLRCLVRRLAERIAAGFDLGEGRRRLDYGVSSEGVAPAAAIGTCGAAEGAGSAAEGDLPLLKPVKEAMLASKQPEIRRMSE